MPKGKRLTTEEFIDRARTIHGHMYDYSKAKYLNCTCFITIICNTCEREFEQSSRAHFAGSGCNTCAKNRRGDTSRFNRTQFIAKARKIHGDKFDYSLMQYQDMITPVEIRCVRCSSVTHQLPTEHLYNGGCLSCILARQIIHA